MQIPISTLRTYPHPNSVWRFDIQRALADVCPFTPICFGLASFIVGPYFFSIATIVMSDQMLNAEASHGAPSPARTVPLLEERGHVAHYCRDYRSCVLDERSRYQRNRCEYQRILGHRLTARTCYFPNNSRLVAH